MQANWESSKDIRKETEIHDWGNVTNPLVIGDVLWMAFSGTVIENKQSILTPRRGA